MEGRRARRGMFGNKWVLGRAYGFGEGRVHGCTGCTMLTGGGSGIDGG